MSKRQIRSRIWTSYDKEADVLYINFKKPSHADDSELTDDDVIIRYEKGDIVGITILMQVGGDDTGTAYNRAYLARAFSLHLNFFIF
jgi:hypothetical protein